MTKYRIRFSKCGKMRFIGHLDLLKLFQRGIKRAGLPIGYSQGFNPHQLVVFALPLTLGHSSTGEYVELNFEQKVEPKEIIAALNHVMPEGLNIISARELDEKEKGGASITSAARYEIEFFGEIESTCLNQVMEQSQILMEKTSKGKTKEVDIRQDIFEITFVSENKIEALLAAGSGRNLKPELLAEYICKNFICKTGNMEYEPYKIKYTRLDMYSEGFKSLSEVMLL